MPTLADFERDYWAPDRDAVLAQMRAQQPPPPTLTSPGWPVGGGGGGAQDPAAYFQSVIAGKPGTPQTLIGLEGELGQQGIKVLRNAAGVAGKIQLPNGQIVDVIRSAGTGGGADNWQWLTGDGGGGGGFESYGGGIPGGFPWTPFSYEAFKPPTGLNFQNDPGYQARMQLGTDAIEKSAAAKGTLLTGGTLKDLNQFAQDYASNEFGNVFNRELQGYQTNFNTAYQPWLSNFNAANQMWQNQLAAQGQRYNQLFGSAQLGLMGTQGLANAGQGYANNVGNILTNQGTNAANLIAGAGNATAAGQAAGGAAWAQGLGGVGEAAQLALLYRQLYGGGPFSTGQAGGNTVSGRVPPLGMGNPYVPGFFGWGMDPNY